MWDNDLQNILQVFQPAIIITNLFYSLESLVIFEYWT